MGIFYEADSLDQHEILPGFKARFVHTAQMTLVFWDIESGAILPEHQHPHEQVGQVTQGEFEMTINGETQVLRAGMLVCIPPNAVHSGRALSDCSILDIFCPVREDYREISAS